MFRSVCKTFICLAACLCAETAFLRLDSFISFILTNPVYSINVSCHSPFTLTYTHVALTTWVFSFSEMSFPTFVAPWAFFNTEYSLPAELTMLPLDWN